MKTDNWELIETITAEYTTYTDFNLEEILEEYNNDNNTNYTLEDIKDYRIKRNTIHLIINNDNDNNENNNECENNENDIEIEYEWVLWETDYKRPDNIYINNNF